LILRRPAIWKWKPSEIKEALDSLIARTPIVERTSQRIVEARDRIARVAREQKS
jgi:hypothetical protein